MLNLSWDACCLFLLQEIEEKKLLPRSGKNQGKIINYSRDEFLKKDIYTNFSAFKCESKEERTIDEKSETIILLHFMSQKGHELTWLLMSLGLQVLANTRVQQSITRHLVYKEAWTYLYTHPLVAFGAQRDIGALHLVHPTSQKLLKFVKKERKKSKICPLKAKG
jgi:hypothetical protein